MRYINLRLTYLLTCLFLSYGLVSADKNGFGRPLPTAASRVSHVSSPRKTSHPSPVKFTAVARSSLVSRDNAPQLHAYDSKMACDL